MIKIHDLLSRAATYNRESATIMLMFFLKADDVEHDGIGDEPEETLPLDDARNHTFGK